MPFNSKDIIQIGGSGGGGSGDFLANGSVPMTGDLNLNGNDINNVNSIGFDTTPTAITPTEGVLQWNATDGTLNLGMNGGDITLQIGQESFIKVRNATGATITNGTVVYFNGSLGNRPTIALARSDSQSTSMVQGICTEDILNNADGFVTTAGYVRQIVTNYTGAGIWGTTWAEGQLLYVSKTTAGQLTNIEPAVPHHSDIVGTVGVIGGAGIGSILVNIARHSTLEGLSDVNGTPLTTSGQIPVWNNTAGYFDFTENITNKFDKTTDDTDDITVGATNKFATTAEKTKLGFVTVTQAVDLDTIETNANNVPAIKTKTDFITVTQSVNLDTMESDIATKENSANKATDFSVIDNTKFPTTQAVETRINLAVTGLLDYRGTYDASTNLYPSTGGSGTLGAVLKGDFWMVSTPGTLGGTPVSNGDLIIALIDTPAQVTANWDLVSNELGYTPENLANKSTTTTLGTSNTLYPTQNAVKVYVDTGLATKQASDAGLTSISALTGAGYVKATATDTFSQVTTIPNTDITGLGTLSTQSGTFSGTHSGTSSGTNTGDQTTIVGITGTKAQFDTAVTDGNFMYVGDAPTAHTHLLANITDVTMTVANLNSLDDGVNSTLHFHNTDRDRANHTGTQLSSTISDFNSATRAQTEAELVAGTNITITPSGTGATRQLTIASTGVGTTNLAYTPSATNGIVTSDTGTDATIPLGNGTNAGLSLNDYTTAEKSKLSGVATGATANSSDAVLLDRANHTGTQLASTISNFNEASQDAIGLMVDTSLTYVDATPLLQRAALTGAITASAGSNATALGSFTTAQLNTALSDNDVATGGGTATGTNTGNQTLANTSNATSHTVTLSATGGSLQLVEGSGITLTTTGTGADGIVTIASTGGGGTLTVQDEGATQSTTVTTLNFTGAGVTASGAGATATINISGGGGGGVTKGIAEIDFGAITQESDVARVTVTDASISATSYPIASPYAIATTDHDPDDYSVEGISATISNIVVGVSFDIVARAPNLTFGKYKFVYHY